MKELLKRLAKYLAYFAAAIVILLAVAVGLFRLMLPRLPEYQEEIKQWAGAAVGMQVEFTGTSLPVSGMCNCTVVTDLVNSIPRPNRAPSGSSRIAGWITSDTNSSRIELRR